MTNPATPARQAIRWTATENGWTLVPNETVAFDRYVRGGVTVNVRFGIKGAVAAGERIAPGAQPEVTGARGKRETVTGWLERDVAVDEAMAAGAELDEIRRGVGDEPVTITRETDEDRGGDERSRVVAAAAAGGWAMFATSDRHHGFSRGDQADRIVELEREVERLAGMDQGLADALAEVASLTARLERNQHDYARARRRIAELEDAPVRKHARRLVEALAAMRDESGPARVSMSVNRAFGLLADALGIDTRPGCPHGGTYSSDCPECARLRRDARERPPTPEAHPAIGDDPRRALEALGIKVRPGLPGERIEVREVERVNGWPRTRVLGFLTDGVFRTDEGRGAREIPATLVAVYVDAVRELGFPAPTARRLAFGYVLANVQRSAPGLGAR